MEITFQLTCVWIEQDTSWWYPCSFKWKYDIAGVARYNLAIHPSLCVGNAA